MGPGGPPFCLLNRPAAEWLVCFVPPKERQWWHRLLGSPLKHCFAIKREAPNAWTLFEPWWSRILIATLTDEEAEPFLNWGREGVILKVKEAIPGTSSQLRVWMSCAALIAHVLGRNYLVYTPAQLLRRLIRERDTDLHQGEL